MTSFFYRALVAVLAAFIVPAHAQAPASAFDAELAAIQTAWAIANYETPAGERRIQALDALSQRAEAFVHASPGRAEPMIWQGIVLSTLAGAKGGIGAMNPAKKSRAVLEAALKVDADALHGSAHTSLGTLYHKVPGFPIGFGDKRKAREHLERALAINPEGIDSNFFYGEFLLDQGEHAKALAHLEKARHAPPRPGRELADAGRRKEIDEAIARLQSKR